jgi:hypothetical protein
VPFALYKNSLKNSKDKGYYARVINQGTCTMEDLVCDIITAGLNKEYSKEDLLTVATLLKNAKLARILTGCTVDDGFTKCALKLSGGFMSKNDNYSTERHTLSVSCSINPEAKELVKTIVPVIRQGNIIEPEITGVFDLETKTDNFLTRNGFLDIKGTNIAVAGENEDIGIYFVNSVDESKTIKLPVEKLGRNEPKRISCVVPGELESGSYKIMVKTQFTSGKYFSKETKTNIFKKEFHVA